MGETFLAKGKRGHAFLREERGTTVLVKRKNPKSAVDTLANEAHFTNLLNTVGVGPAFISYDKERGELVREYVKGEELRRWLPSAGREAVEALLVSILKQCKVMDDVGVNKEEMTRPWKHIIVTPAQAGMLIDFERCREAKFPKNVTQFCQFLCSASVTAKLKTKKIIINNKKLLELAKRYKQNIKTIRQEQNDKNYEQKDKIFNEMVRLVEDA
jgi:predicted Ser/Thr protein kinase